MKSINEIKQDLIDNSQHVINSPSDKQCWYLAKLLSEKGEDASGLISASFHGEEINSRLVSKEIDRLKNNTGMYAPNNGLGFNAESINF